MTFPVEALQQHIAIVGKTGSGKTYTAKGLVEGLLEAKRRVCILDPTGAWYGLRSSANGKKAGFPVVVFGGLHGDLPIAENSGATLAHILASKNLPAIIDLSEMLIGQRHRFVTDFAEALYRENKFPLHLIIDEADEFIPQNPLPETKRLLHHIDRIIRRGRIRGFRVMMITQRPAVIHKNALTQANTLVAMRLTAPQDRNAIKAWIEGNGDQAMGKTLLDSLASLQRGHGWVWSPELDVLKRETFPHIKTFDSSRTPDDEEAIPAPTKLADVDLGEIRAAFKQIEDEVRTLDDLKKEVAQLKKRLAEEAKRSTTPAGVPEAMVQKRVRNAIADALQKLIPRLEEAVRSALKNIPDGSHSAAVVETATSRSPSRAQPERPAPVPRPAVAASAAGNSLPSGERDVLIAIAQHPNGVTREQLTVLIGFKRSTRDAYIYRMSKRGLIDIGPPLTATEEGIAALGDFTPLPTGEALQQHWLSNLPAGEASILGQLCAAYPDPVDRESISQVHNYARSSRDAYIHRLKARQLITIRPGGTVRAAEHLFS